MTSPTKPPSIDRRLLATARRKKPGMVFVPSDFLKLGNRSAIDVALHRLTASGDLRRLARGLYDIPRTDPTIGLLLPSAEEIARALAGRDRTRLQPAGAYAANLLGLSDQVPAKAVFLTDGPTRSVTVGPTTIQLRRTTARSMEAAGRLSGLLIQALRSLGKDHVTPARIAHLKKTLPAAQRRALLKDLRLAPVWMHPVFRELAGAKT